MASNRMATTQPPQSPATSYSDESDGHDGHDGHDGLSLDDEDLLALLGDEYTRRVLRAVADERQSGREVMDAADVSKATAYRRLDRLQEAGLVDSELVIDPNGHHHEEFFAVVDRADISVCSEGIDISLTRDDAGRQNS